jgi:DNA polymerase III subunit epsilon
MTWWRWWERVKERVGRPGAGGATAADPRWVVVDVEASGLDAASDRLLAIAGVAVRFRSGEPWLQLADSFEVILRQEEGVGGEETAVDKPNILLHGIGVGAQRGGVPTEVALAAFRGWVADSPIVGYHAAFDQTLIQRYCARHLGRRLDNAWADLEHVVLLVVPGLPDRSLDSAMARLGVGCLRRHQAAADSLATAEVLMKIWRRAREQMGGRTDFKAFRRLAARHHWLPREGS